VSWIPGFFRAPVFTPGAAEALAAAPAEAAAAWRRLGLKRGERVLDLACGTGRHSVELARRGAFVLGVDQSAAYLAQARRAARGLTRCRFARGDMRRLNFRGEFDAVINLWTSFGYFRAPGEDLAVLKGVARALKPGGRFLIELVDHAWVRSRPSHRHWDRRADGSFVLQDAHLVEGRDPRVVNEWTILRPGRRALTARFVLRGYDRPRLSALLRRAGLVPARFFGDMGVTRGKGRLVVLARKPRA
jgi:SAM-dependent methyltransferase